MSKIGIVIEREYMERVKKKSFIITTLLMPLLMLLLMAMPALIMSYVDSSAATVAVIDNTRVILPELRSSEDLRFCPAVDATVDSALTREGIDAVLVIPENIIDNPRAGLKYYTSGPSSVGTEAGITDRINSIIEAHRLKAYNIENLDEILSSVKSDVSLTTVRADKDSEESNSSMFSYGIGIAMTFVLYMFLLIYGQMVMTSIIEEKGNRVLEVVVSSVKPVQLMMGKIIGVALVAVTQMVIRGVLLSVMSAFVLPALVPADAMADVAAVQSGHFDQWAILRQSRSSGHRDARQCRQYRYADGADDGVSGVRLPALFVDFRSRRISRRQYSGCQSADIIGRVSDSLRTDFCNGGRRRPDGERGVTDVDVPADIADGDGGPHTVRDSGLGNSVVARASCRGVCGYGPACRKDLPRGHLHVWQKPSVKELVRWIRYK